MINIIAAIICLLIATILLAQFTLRYIYNYQISDTGIEIVLFSRVPVKKIYFSNIEEIRKLSFKETLLLFSALRFGNRVYGDIVLIRQRKGLVKTILITPDNADRFVGEVLQHIQHGDSGNRKR